MAKVRNNRTAITIWNVHDYKRVTLIIRTDGYHLRKYKSYPDDHSVPLPKSMKLDRNKRSATRSNTAILIPQSFASTELAAVPTESSASHNEETIVQEKEAIIVR